MFFSGEAKMVPIGQENSLLGATNHKRNKKDDQNRSGRPLADISNTTLRPGKSTVAQKFSPKGASRRKNPEVTEGTVELFSPKKQKLDDGGLGIYFNIDLGDEGDAQLCAPYVPEIFELLRESENKFRMKVDYMNLVQREITPQMRAILCNWLVEVVEEFKLNGQTLYLAVNYMDRFLEKFVANKNNLQLIGIVCLFLAAKYEEIFAPVINDFVHISDGTYNKDEIMKMEMQVLTQLEFNLTVPTSKTFLRRFLKAAGAEKDICLLAQYLLELTLQDYTFSLLYCPSISAAAAVCLALLTAGKASWNSTLEHYTQYKTNNMEFQNCVRDLYRIYKNAAGHSLQAVREKYSQTKYLRVSEAYFPPTLSSN
eukprot:TRINITY_DN1877_c0_g2_i1.p1 TRINITY_DN1877_c0_g2~~TRINITY_DN1877_c0_g2_i1.p1  ORF type:complete len:369 (-),score=57.28 TRINITY_DN1877_c0_g2_i1:238-1344(-)